MSNVVGTDSRGADFGRFVIDGDQRIAPARRRRIETIDADVTEPSGVEPTHVDDTRASTPFIDWGRTQ